jgi:hypothetical protein
MPKIREDKTIARYPSVYLNPITKPTYVIRMGWHRWGPEAQAKWLRELRRCCEETIRRIDEDLFWVKNE